MKSKTNNAVPTASDIEQIPGNYEAALQELQKLLQQMEQGQSSIDELSYSVKRAKFLVEWCQQRLRSVEESL